MKHKLLLSIFLFTTTFGVFAQSPDSFNYQAVIRDASSNILSNQSVGIQFKLLQGSPVGTSVYTETHATTTDTFGLVALAVGTGSSSDDFSTIDWANGPYFLEISADVNGGTSYSVLGTQQLLSTPYALYAKNSGSAAPSDKITDADNNTKIQVEETGNEDIIRFDASGQEIMTLNQTTIDLKRITRLYTSGRTALTLKTTDNSLESGLAFQNSGSYYSWTLFREPLPGDDSNANLVFAGGVSQDNPNTLTERMRISNTGNVGINTNNPDEKLHVVGNIKMVDGNQAVGNVLVSDANGVASWQPNLGPVQNKLIDADNNTKIQVEETSNEDIIRFDLGGTEQMVLTKNAQNDARLILNPTGTNIFIGNNTGTNTTGGANIFLGNYAGASTTTGLANTFLGGYAGTNITTGDWNVFLGGDAGKSSKNGDTNTFIGSRSGFSNTSGNGNVFLGDSAGYFELGSSKLYIDNTVTSSPLIYGEFNNDLVRIGGKLEVTNDLNVIGSTIIGSNGTPLNSIIKVTIGKNLPNISSGNSYTTTFTVTGASVGGAVSISPANALENGLIISYARVSSPNTIEVKFRNVRNSGIDQGYMNWYISVIN